MIIRLQFVKFFEILIIEFFLFLIKIFKAHTRDFNSWM